MSEIKSRIMTPATTSNYEVFFGVLQGPLSYIKAVNYGIPYTKDDEILIHLSCMDTTLPGSSFSTHDITNDYTGVTEKHAYRREYDGQIDFTFLVDRNYKIIRFFEAWMGYITGDRIGRQVFDPSNPAANYRVKFPKDYQTPNLHIVKFEKDIDRVDQQSQLFYTFINAFPISINSMPVSYGQSELLKVTVTMSYTRYYIGTAGSPLQDLLGNFGKSVNSSFRYTPPELNTLFKNSPNFWSNIVNSKEDLPFNYSEIGYPESFTNFRPAFTGVEQLGFGG